MCVLWEQYLWLMYFPFFLSIMCCVGHCIGLALWEKGCILHNGFSGRFAYRAVKANSDSYRVGIVCNVVHHCTFKITLAIRIILCIKLISQYANFVSPSDIFALSLMKCYILSLFYAAFFPFRCSIFCMYICRFQGCTFQH